MVQPAPKPLRTEMTPTFQEAIATVKEKIHVRVPGAETLPLEQACGRVLAQQAKADRDYPPFHRSTRDGFAVRSADLASSPAVLECVGEVRAGTHFEGKIQAGECVSIMTGAPLPTGADAVVMVERTRQEGSRVESLESVSAFENVVRQGSEAPAGSIVLERGRKLGAAEVALLASIGAAQVEVFRPPAVRILTTGDELVAVDQTPPWFQIRNSNTLSLAAQVAAAGGIPKVLGVAPDRKDRLKELIQQGLRADLLILSGGVSVGKYDRVEEALEELGAKFYFRSVAIRPGHPVVFGRVGETFFFGLPGNPVSAYVTFEVFVRPALGVLAGSEFSGALFLGACLAKPLQHKPGFTRFVPARVERVDGVPTVSIVGWQGSGDLRGLAEANCFVVVHPEQASLDAGEWVDVMLKESGD
ncbi:MAG: molybdopterin molybdotransferase MoeA [Terriglobia bacterium]